MNISNLSSSASLSYSPLPSSHLDELLLEKKYREASLELSLKFQTESPDNEEQLSLIYRDYQTIIEEGELESSDIRSLRHEFLTFLKRLLKNHPFAERTLLDEVNALLQVPGIEWNRSNQIEAFLLLYNLCPSQRQEICQMLMNLLKETKLLQEVIPMRNLEELELLLGSAQKSLGDACVCLRTFLNEAIRFSPIVLPAREMINHTLGEDLPFYFPKQLQESLHHFRERFKSSFDQQFLKISLNAIHPKEVRQFQRERYNDFHENVLETLLAFPLQVLNQKKIQAELHVYGSIAREELVPFSDLETIFLLEENDRLEPNGRFLGSLIEWIGIQVTALGESPPTLPKELNLFIEKIPPKGLSLDATPNLAIPPLRTMNASLPICMTTLSTLCQFQRERELIEELEKELKIAVHSSDEGRKRSRERRLGQILEGTSHPEAREEISILLQHLHTPQFKELFDALKKRVYEQEASVALAALRQKLEEFELQNERDLNQALGEHQMREQAFQKLSREIETAETQKLLFSLLKTKKIAASSEADFRYEEHRAELLNEIVENSSHAEQITRRQKKALCKIDQLDRAQKPEKILQTTLDLKDDFIIPIFYPLAPLAVYYDIEATNTLDIIDQLAKQKRITESSEMLLKQTVAALYVMRVRFHFRFRQSPWEGSHDEASRLPHLPNSLSIDEQRALDRAYWMVQRPLHDYLVLFKEQGQLTMDLEHLALHRFKKEVSVIDSQAMLVNRYRSFIDCYARYLAACRAPLEKHLDVYEFLSTSLFYEPLRKIYLETLKEEQIHPRMIDTLAAIPNRDGYRQSYRMDQEELLTRIEQLSLPEDQDSSYQGTEVIFEISGQGRRKLKSEWIPNLFNLATGQLNPYSPETPDKPEYQECRHTVRSIPKYGLHIKAMPDHPAMEYAVGNLVHRLFRSGPPATQLVRVTVSKNSERTSYPILFSETVFGSVFNPTKDQINPVQFTELLISHVLLLPGDANARNFIFFQSSLRCIDNDVSLVDPVIRSGIFREVQLTSILFCLKQPLILDRKVIDNFCDLDPLLVLNGWLEDVIQREKSYTALFPEIQERRLLLERNREQSFTPFFILGPGSIARLYEQIIKLQNLFREDPNKEWRPFDLLDQVIGRSDRAKLESSEIGPYIRKAYQNAFSAPSASERLRKAVGRNVSQSMTSSQALQAQIGKIPSAEELEKKQAFSPEQALQELFAFDFENFTNLSMIVHTKEQKNFKSAFQIMLKEGKPDLERQRLVLSCLLRSRTLLKMNSLNLSYSAVLDDSWLESVIHQFPHLEVLDLRHCPLITSKAVELIAKGLKNLRELYISGCPQITALESDLGVFRGTGPLMFPELTLLHAGHCLLNRLNLQADKLIDLKINGSPPLLIQGFIVPSLERLHCSNLMNAQSLDRLTNLKKLHLTNCHAMTDEDFSQLLSQNPGLQELILENCSQISKLPDHPNLHVLSLTNLPLVTIKGNYSNLTAFHCENCGQLKEITIPKAPLAQFTAKNCSRLKSLQSNPETLENLNIERSKEVIFHEYPILAYKNLKKMNLSDSQHISKEDIQKIPLELPLLEELCLNGCHLSGVIVFSNPFPRLKTLQMQNTKIKSLSIKGNDLVEIDLSDCSLNAWGKSSLDVPNLKVIYLTELKSKDFKQLNCLPKNVEKMISVHLNEKIDLKTLISTLQRVNNIRARLTQGHIKEVLEFMKAFPNQVTQLGQVSPRKIGTANVQALAKALSTSHVTKLDLGYHGIKDAEAQVLANALPTSHLTQLDLNGNKIRDTGVEALAKALPASHLTQLSLNSNKKFRTYERLIKDAGAEALAHALPASHLTQLDLGWSEIGDAGAKALAKALPTSHLTQLNLEYSKIGDVGAKALAKALPASLLTHLKIGSRIGFAGAEALANALPVSRLTSLDLERTEIGNAGAEILAKTLPTSRLTWLNLKDNRIGDAGAKALAQALPASCLITLLLNENNIGNAGAKALAKILPFSRLTYLNLWLNNIESAGIEALSSKKLNQKTRVSIGNQKQDVEISDSDSD